MTLIEIEPALRAEMTQRKSQSLFAAAQEIDPALAHCETPEDLLAVLDDASAEGYPKRELLIRAAIAAYQRQPSSIWSSLLILAFLPMLRHLASRAITGPEFDRGELEQIIVSRFLAVVAQLDLDKHTDKTFVRVRSATEDGVFGAVSREQRQQRRRDAFTDDDVGALVEGQGSAWPAHSRPRERGRMLNVEARVAFLEEHVAPHLRPEHFELVMTTLGRGGTIAEYVREQHAELSEADRRRLYQRLKRCHSRAVRRLRDTLGPLRGALEAGVHAQPS